MLSVEGNHHLDNFTEQWESEFEIEDVQPTWCLVLLNPQSFKFRDSETISPPISLVFAVVDTLLDSCCELLFASDICYASEIWVMHYQQLLLLGVDHVQFDEVGTLVQSC